MPKGDPLAYGRAAASLWKQCLLAEDDLCLIEQDIEVGPATLYDFRACSHWWCGNPYPWTTSVGVALGCVRFRYQFIKAYPTAVEQAIAIAPHFRQFDVALERRVLADKFGQQPHVHHCVVHHNPAKALRDEASPVPLEGVPVGDIGALL